MDLKTYIETHTTRKEFAEKIGTTIFYLNNLCQDSKQAGKKIAFRIEKETGGLVKPQDLWFTETNEGQGA